MKSKDHTVSDQKQRIAPRLRFPEFKDSEQWSTKPLSEFVSMISERVGDRAITPLSITSGVGLVTQTAKYGRSIAGQQLKNYFVLRKGDFAYNKSATKECPQGFIATYSGDGLAAVPNSIFTCFRVQTGKLSPSFLRHLFAMNLHGKWLSNFLTVGARAHGSLNIDDKDLLSLPVPVPNGPLALVEQEKIAECLSSGDDLIGTETRKLEALKNHKKALLQQLFTAEGETMPRLRFPEFCDAGEWLTIRLGKGFEISSGGTPDRSKKEFWNGSIPWVTTSLLNYGHITSVEEYISEEGLRSSSAKMFPRGTVLIAMYGQGKTRGKVSILDCEAATNQACAAILPSKKILPEFVSMNLGNRYEELRSLSNPGGQENLSQALIKELEIRYPADIEEQKKITACLSMLEEQMSGQIRRIELLKNHKKGLMQQLFPALDEVQT